MTDSDTIPPESGPPDPAPPDPTPHAGRPWIHYEPLPVADPLAAAERFYSVMARRRSVREFSTRPVSRAVIEQVILAAATAPSGAHKQPWRFVAIDDPAVKAEIRRAAEAEEREFYTRRATPEWLADLAPLQTGPEKPFLEDAPWLIAIFKLMKTDDGGQVYYVNESVGIAAGMLISAIHHAGLVTLTHTPSPMRFLTDILHRPAHERPFLLLPVGYPAEGVTVPDLARKPLDQVMAYNTGSSA